MTADAWAAIAQWITVGVAGWALIYARGQVKEARETREKVAQPDVVVYIDHNENDWHHMDLVVRNFGQTPAYNIRLTLPPLQVVPFDNEATGERVATLYVPQSIAVLAPGQEWRTAWESGIEIEEYDGELASNYVGRVDYNGTMNQAQPAYNNPISLDTNMFRDMHRISTERSRTVEKALYEISDTLKGYKRKHGGIWVYTVPGTEEQGYYEQLAESRRPRRDLT